MVTIPIITTQSSPLFSFTQQQQATIELGTFLRKNRLMDFKYDSSNVTNGAVVAVFPKRTVGTREVSGEISKDAQDGKIYFTLIVDEKDAQTQKQFEDDVAGIYAGLKLRSSRQILTRCQIAKLPGGQWGAKIKLELEKSGDYEFLIGTPAKPPPPKPSSP
jgi:hypothetical protein